MSHAQNQGIKLAIVKKLDDPENLGRVKVNLSDLDDENQTYWAHVATAMAGNNHGTWFMPEEGDAVLVAFRDGDAGHPFVLGSYWSSKNPPPIDDGATTTVKRMRTKGGHILEFDDRSDSAHILVQTSSGHLIELLNDKNIRIETSTGQKVELINNDSISVSFDGSNTITLNSEGVTLDGSKVVINGGSVEITASSGDEIGRAHV